MLSVPHFRDKPPQQVLRFLWYMQSFISPLPAALWPLRYPFLRQRCACDLASNLSTSSFAILSSRIDINSKSSYLVVGLTNDCFLY